MKKDLSNSLKASLDEERKYVKSKSFNNIEDRFAKAEAAFNDDVDNYKEKAKDLNNEVKKEKIVRDTFSIPIQDYVLISKCKEKALIDRLVVNKSEIIRAGLILLDKLAGKDFIEAIEAVKKIKTGRSKLKV